MNNWKVGIDIPEWANNDLYLTTIKGGYLQEDESPKEMYDRLATTAANHHGKPEWKEKFFELFWNQWFIPSTPVAANLGTSRGLPISCFAGIVGDDMYEIGRKELEMRMLSKYGGGTAYSFNNIRPSGALIQGGKLGKAEGPIPFMKSYDSTIISSKQGKQRRGAVAIYLDAMHGDYLDFLKVREPKGDIDRQCHNIHQGAIFTDDFMKNVTNPKSKEYEIWVETQKKRIKTGEPYMFFEGNANRNLPKNWKENNLTVKHSNLCSEIMLPTDENHTLVCCLGSMNIATFDTWSKTDAVKYAIYFLDAVISEFIESAGKIKGIEDAKRFAEKSRALGLGALGWHTYLQSKNLPFVSVLSNGLTKKVFGHIQSEAIIASEELANLYGEPEWCIGTGLRNLTLMTIAPNRSSSKLAGGISQGVEPIAANMYVDDDAKGLHIRKNVYLENLLKSKNMNNKEVWNSISAYKGSVQHLPFLTDDEKDVFKTFKEINQLELVKQAGIRQEYIDQGQSINIAFHTDAPAKLINQVHYTAWKVGLKSLYYLRSESNLQADSHIQRDLFAESIIPEQDEGCTFCEG